MADVITYINERKASNNFIDCGDGIYREPKPQEALEAAFTAITAKVTTPGSANTNYILPTKDHKTLVLIKSAEASDAKTVTFKKGNSYQGVADFTVTVAAGKELWVTLDSAKYADKETGLIEVDTSETTASKIFLAVLEAR